MQCTISSTVGLHYIILKKLADSRPIRASGSVRHTDRQTDGQADRNANLLRQKLLRIFPQAFDNARTLYDIRRDYSVCRTDYAIGNALKIYTVQLDGVGLGRAVRVVRGALAGAQNYRRTQV
jgi:hypothetical protein